MIGGAGLSAAVRASAREMLDLRSQSRAGFLEAAAQVAGVNQFPPEGVTRPHRAKANTNRKAKAKVPEEWRRKYLIETFGCQMNVHDSERMAGLLEQAGYEPTDDERDADVIVINTCSVRERAEEKLFTRLGEIRHMGLEAGTRPVVAVAGCVAQQEGDRILQAFEGRRRHRRHPEHQTAADARRRRRRSRSRTRPAGLALDPVDDVSFPLGIARRERPAQGLRHDHRGLQRVLRLLRRPVHARPRADAAGRRHPGRRAPCGCDRREGNPAARADRQSLPGAGRSVVRFRRPARAAERDRGADAHPVREPASAPCHAAHDCGDARPAGGLPASASAGAIRARRASLPRCGGATRASTTSNSSRSCARPCRTSRYRPI